MAGRRSAGASRPVRLAQRAALHLLLLAVVLTLHGGLEAVVAAELALAVLPVVHQVGHLGAGVLVGAHPVTLRLYGFQVGRSFPAAPPSRSRHAVIYDPDPQVRALPARMLVGALAGPAVTLVVAVAALVLAYRPGVGAPVAGGLVGVGAAALVQVAADLIPRPSVLGTDDDAGAVLAWLFAPRRRRQEMAAARTQLELIRYAMTMRQAGQPESDLLALAIDQGDRALSTAAASQLLGLILSAPAHEQDALMSRETWRLSQVASDPDTTPATAALIAGLLCVYHAGRLIDTRLAAPIWAWSPPAPDSIRWIEQLAEHGYRAQPENVPALVGLGMVRLLQGRWAEVRWVLVGRGGTNAWGAATRALAEVRLDDLPQARRLINTALSAAPDEPFVRRAAAVVALAEDETSLPGQAGSTSP